MALPPRPARTKDALVPDAYAIPLVLAVLAASLAMVSIRRERWMAHRLSRSAGEEFADSLELLHACLRIRTGTMAKGRLARTT